MAGLNAAGHPDGVRRRRAGVGGLLAAARHRRGRRPSAARHTHYDIGEAFKSVTKWVGEIGRAELVPDYLRRAFTQLRSGRPGPVLLLIPRDLGEYDEAEHPYTTVKGWRTGPDPDDVTSAIKALAAAEGPAAVSSARASSTPTPPRSCCASPSWRRCPC